MAKLSALMACAGLAVVVSAGTSALPGGRVGGSSALVEGGAERAPVIAPISPVRSTIGTATNGQAIELWTLGAPGVDAQGRGVDERPAVLIVAGLQGHHTVGVATARGVVERLARDHAEALQGRTVYVVPSVALGADAWVAGRAGPRVESGRIPGAGDADGDGRLSEDAPEDLNGDGMITQMRVRRPDPRWGLRANLIPNPDEPRLMREARAADGEIGEWAVLTEGIDNDGDGKFNEDGGGSLTGGTDLSMNFPTHYPEHEEGAGEYQLSSPEALALVRWVQSRDNILAVVVYDPHDTLVNVPAAGQYGPEGSVPRGIEEGDRTAFGRVSEVFKEITRMTGAGASPGAGRTPGSFASWAYGDFGVMTFSTPVWVRPDQIKSERAEEGAVEGGAAEAPAEDPAARRSAEKARLMAEGFPERMAEFLAASVEERRAIIQQASTMTEAEQAAMMMEMMSLSPAQQQRMMEAAREAGLNMGAPRGRGGAPGGGPPGHHHDDEEESPSRRVSSVGSRVGLDLAMVGSRVFGLGAQPAGGGRRPGAQPAGGGGGGGAARSGGGGGDSGGEDRKWLTYSDEQRDATGFVAWTAFEHPQLGPLEIGGFVPGFRVNPPEGELERLADEQTAFVVKLLGMLPDVVLEGVEAQSVGGSLWRVRSRVVNPGTWATLSAIGQKARRVTPIVVSISTEPARVLTGPRVRRFESIEGSGGFRESEWLIQGEAGESVTVELRSSVYGTRRQTIRLGDGQTGGGR